MAKAARKSGLATSGEELGEQILQSIREMKAGLRGRVHTPEGAGIVEARLGSGLSQASFAALMGVFVRTPERAGVVTVLRAVFQRSERDRGLCQRLKRE